MKPVPPDVLVERHLSRENVKRLVSSSFMCNRRFQEFLSLVLPDLEQSALRVPDPLKEKQVRVAAEKAIKELRSYGFELRKAEAMEKTSERDIEDYSTQRHQIEESIKGVQEEIGVLKEGLVVERKKRQNKEIYEEMCKDINKYPPHRATKLAIENLEQELASLSDQKRAVHAVQKLKHKQIALLLQSLADIQAAVEEGELEDTPTAGALELVGVDDELLEDGDGDGDGEEEGGAEGEGEGDGDGEDDNGVGNNDEDPEMEKKRRRGRKRSPSAESDDGRAAAANGGMPPLRGPLGEDEEMPDTA